MSLLFITKQHTLYNIFKNSKIQILNQSYSQSKLWSVTKRTMMLFGGIHGSLIARSAFHVLQTFVNDDTLNQLQCNNLQSLTKSLATLSLDNQAGVAQHKTALVCSIMRPKVPLERAYESLDLTDKLVYSANVYTDPRFMNEVPPLKEYISSFGESISKIEVTGDSLKGSFPHQKQTNQDFWSTIFTKKLDKAMGLGTKLIPQDAKSGMGMFQHSSSGTIGLLTYDHETKTNVQIVNKPISVQDLIQHDLSNLRMLEQTFKQAGLANHYEDIIAECRALLKTPNATLEIHDKYQKILWDNIQRDPQYERSISFIFTKEIAFEPSTVKMKLFEDRFLSLLDKHKLYNLDRPQDRIEIFRALLIAFKSVDPKLKLKIEHLRSIKDLNVTQDFLNVFVTLIKEHIF